MIRYRSRATGRIVAVPEPADPPIRRQAQRARQIATMDAAADWERLPHQGGTGRPSDQSGLAGHTDDTKTAAGFDPGTHTVADVNHYLTGADSGERDRVLAAEQAGRGRAGIIRGPYARAEA